MMRLILALIAALFAFPALAQDEGLTRLDTADQARGWDAVGRIDLGKRGFCTGAMIAPNLVLTAAHCLFDKETGARIDPATIEFRAGWRNGRAAAYRKVRRAVPHPDYVYGGQEGAARVAHDLALIELDQPIRLPSVVPFATDARPAEGDEVGVVSYAQDRSDAPSLQQVCHVIAGQPEVLVLSCSVDFGSSGAPIFALRNGEVRVVSVVSAKADYQGQRVALGTALEAPLLTLMTEIQASHSHFAPPGALEAGSASSSAKFVKP